MDKESKGIISIVFIILIFLLGRWIKRSGVLTNTEIYPLLFLAFIAFVAIATLIIVFSVLLRTVMSEDKNPPKLPDPQPADVDDYPWVDRQTVEKWSDDLQRLGFNQIQEVCQTLSGAKFIAFSRLFGHGNNNCFASVSQAQGDYIGTTTVACSTLTYFYDGWLLETDTYDEYKVPGHYPKLVRHVKPELSVEQLLTLHIDQRNALVLEKGLRVRPGSTLEDHKTFSAEYQKEVSAWLGRKKSLWECIKIVLQMLKTIFFTVPKMNQRQRHKDK